MFFLRRLNVKSICVIFRTRHHVWLIFKWITPISMTAQPFAEYICPRVIHHIVCLVWIKPNVAEPEEVWISIWGC